MSVLAWAWCPQMARAVSSATAFRPVNPEELKMTNEPAAPGAPAIILYREVYRDDGDVYIDPSLNTYASGRPGHEDDYFRIKILTEEGRKYANVEILYNPEVRNITGIHARTIKPDGSIVNFDGKVATKLLLKAGGTRYLAKTLTLPDVQIGSILEYFYTIDLSETHITASRWILSNELFTKAASFSLMPYGDENYPFHNYLRCITQNMGPGAPQPIQGPDKIIRLQVANIPAFVTENLMPPENELKERVDFSYSEDEPAPDVNHFWAKVGKRLDDKLESFIGKRKAMEQAVSGIVGPDDPPEVKLQKIYARVQQMHNTSYEVRKTEEELKRAKEKPPVNAEEVWKRGEASGQQLTWLYLAMVRAAGFEAYGVWTASRESYFFDPGSMLSRRLDSNLVLIKLNGKNIFCDPGAAFVPFGFLPWQETGVMGLQLDKQGVSWVQTLVPTAAQTRSERRANLTLTDTGDLEGKLTVTYMDMEAAAFRRNARNADEPARNRYLENIQKGYIPAASDVNLTNQPEWKNSAAPLVAEFDLKVPGWASRAGHHFMVPVGLFSAHEKHVFDHAERVHPIYIDYPYTHSDDVNIQIPAGWQVSSLPAGWQYTAPNGVSYSLTAANDQGKLHISRTLTVDFILMEAKYYSALREHFQQIKTTDDQQIVLDPSPARAAN